MHKNKFATLSGMCRAIVFVECVAQLFLSHFDPKTLHNAKFLAQTRLFSEVTDPTTQEESSCQPSESY